MNSNKDYYKLYQKYKSKYLKIVFLSWFKKNNGFNNLQLINDPYSGKEALAKHNIKSNELLVKVPFDLMISVNNGIGDGFINDLIFKLLEHKKNKTFLEYINFLPANYDFLVHNWNEDKINIIKNTSVYPSIIKSKNEKERRYNEYITKYNNINLNDYNWAYGCVVTRNFSVYKKGIKYNCLVPYADLINHSNTNNATWSFLEKEDSFVIHSNKDISDGSNVYVSYGYLDGLKSLTWYGFFMKEYHSFSIDNFKFDNNSKINLPDGIKKKAVDKLNILKTDYNNFSYLENNNKYNEPLKVLKTEIELLKKFEY